MQETPNEFGDISVIPDVSSGDSRFAEYWNIVLSEFRGKIPWVEEVDISQVSAHLVVENQKVIGGLALFKQSPESKPLIEDKEAKFGKGGLYVSCFVMDKEHKGKITQTIFNTTLNSILHAHGPIWFVADSKMAPYYERFGAKHTATINNLEIYSIRDKEITS
ncbi:MAG: hypothetical protein Q7S50_00420 [bacterium]|nr:hypothetical protein [bacterium]